jgi:hypothetical protein
VNIIDAAHATVRNYPGGSESLAPRMITRTEDGREKAMSAAVLRNKVGPNNTTHHLTLAEADQIMGLTGDHRILHALAAEHGYTLQRIDAPDTGSMIGSLLSASAAKGDLAEILSAAMADNRITPNEATDIARACAAVQAAIVRVSQHAAESARVGQP